MWLWFAVRMFGSAIVAAYGANKLFSGGRAALLGRREIVMTFGVIEIALATLWVLNPLPLVGAATALATGAIVTTVGIANIRRTGRCGCGGPEARTPGQLIRRNAVLFLAIALGTLLGPDAAGVGQSYARQLEAALLAPIATVVLIVVAYRMRAVELADS